MTRNRKYSIFVLSVAFCYLFLPSVYTILSPGNRNAEKTVFVLVTGLIATLFNTWYLDVLLIILPLTWMLLKTRLTTGRLHVQALLLLMAFFAVLYIDDVVCFNRFIENFHTYYRGVDLGKWNIVPDNHKTLSNFLTYNLNLPLIYYGRMDEDTRGRIMYCLPTLPIRIWLSVVIAIVTVFVRKFH